MKGGGLADATMFVCWAEVGICSGRRRFIEMWSLPMAVMPPDSTERKRNGYVEKGTIHVCSAQVTA